MARTRYPFVDCQGLAGAWTLGTMQTGGFELVHRASLAGGFGDQAVDSNREHLGYDWAQDPAGSSAEWEPVEEVAYLAGTPPCSGFSLLNNSAAAARKAGRPIPATARGEDSSINDCMKELVHYASRCRGTDGKKGPEVVSFESVQQAFSKGRGLMSLLRAMIEERTGEEYNLYHVKMSGSTVGAAQMRHRYFWLVSRVPFGITRPQPRKVVTYRDAIGDLVGLENKWETQDILREPDGMWLLDEGMRRSDGLIDAHQSVDTSRMRIYLEDLWPYWNLGEAVNEPLERYIYEHGQPPRGAERWWDYDAEYPSALGLIKGNRRGFSGPRRIIPDRPGYVLTGGGIHDFIHWDEKRFLSVRETARLMGYPDHWTFDAAKGVNQSSLWIGKCCPVQSGRWISQQVLNSLDGDLGDATFETVGDREYLFDCTNDYKRWPVEISGWDARPKRQRLAEAVAA